MEERKNKTPDYVLRAVSKYKKKATRNITLNFHKEYKKDVLDWLDQQPNKTGYIVDLIREDMKRQGK